MLVIKLLLCQKLIDRVSLLIRELCRLNLLDENISLINNLTNETRIFILLLDIFLIFYSFLSLQMINWKYFHIQNYKDHENCVYVC